MNAYIARDTAARAESFRPAVNKNVATGRMLYENAVIVTRKTQLEELTDRFNTAAQARFYLEHAGQPFDVIEQAHKHYHDVLNTVLSAIPRGVKSHVIERSYLPQYSFQKTDLVITIGPDGLVVNTAKYVGEQAIVAVNPDPTVIDGVLLSYTANRLGKNLPNLLTGEGSIKRVSMAQAQLNDGQELLAFNDLFIGARSHVSARYHLAQGQRGEDQSSSGVIVSTGAGSTGWLQSVYAGAAGVVQALGGNIVSPPNQGRLPWDTDHLMYAVREPFPSKASKATQIFGTISNKKPLVIQSQMAENGVIFSDGIESDYLHFNAGSTVTISLAKHKAHLVA